MNHRNAPFQFMSIDPAKRQAELEKRFGLSKFNVNDSKMHLDLENPGLMGMKKESSSASSSPRLQHRVPIFVEGMDEPVQSKADANPTNVDAGQKPRVRVVPIEVETDDMAKRRARAFSGDPYTRGPRLNSVRTKDPWFDAFEPKPEVKPTMAGPRVCNIPIKVERGVSNPKSAAKTVPVTKEPVSKTIPVEKEVPVQRVNGTDASKQSPQEPARPPQPFEQSLKKIATVLEKLVGYQADVEKFTGTSKDKQYRYLDEMLTRLMLDLDNVETMGNEDVRLKRKEAIRKVQHCIDLLESKVCDAPSQIVEPNSEVCDAQTDEVPKLDEVEMKEEETKPAEEAEVPVSRPEAQEIEISEVGEGEVSSQEEVVAEPVVSEVNETGDTLENCQAETEVKITEVESDQLMEVDEAEASVAETVKVDNSEPNGIPDSKTDIEMNGHVAKNDTSDEGMSESNLSQTSS